MSALSFSVGVIVGAAVTLAAGCIHHAWRAWRIHREFEQVRAKLRTQLRVDPWTLLTFDPVCGCPVCTAQRSKGAQA